MVGKTIVILGGGFGGLVAVQQLRRMLPPEQRFAVLDHT